MNDLVIAKFNPQQPRDPDGEWSDGIPGPAADPLKLAGRIKLGPGERFGGSARVHDANGDLSAVMARVDGPDGPRLRFGVVHPDDTRRWRAENKGATVELDRAGATQMREVLRSALADGKKSVAGHQAQLRALHKQGVPRDEWPSPEAEIASGAVPGERWGDVQWSLTREEGDDYVAGGVNYGPGGFWLLTLDAVPSGGAENRDPFRAETASTVNRLDKAIGDLLGADPVTASTSHLNPGGRMAELLGVELARPGTWQLSSGRREFTAQMLRDAADFYASTGGQRIPLGFGHMDARFDGDPAFGWLANVRYGEDASGPVLLGDLVDLDDWVAAAAPARWPHRSIEGVMGVTFNGREYGLALTRLALLGSTPPGIPVLKSLSDVRQLVAASVAATGGEWIAASAPETSPIAGATPTGEIDPTTREGAAGMSHDAAKLREALGLKSDASDDEVKAALASAGLVGTQPEPQPAPDPTPVPQPEPTPAPTPDRQPDLVAASAAQPGTLVIASSVWEQTQKTIKDLTSFVDQTKRSERDQVIAKAVVDGKFTPAQKTHFARLWDADPDGTRSLIDNLTKNSALAVAASGYDSDSDEAIDREYAHLFPPKAGGRRG